MSRVTVCFAGPDAGWADREPGQFARGLALRQLKVNASQRRPPGRNLLAEWARQKGYDVDRLSDDTVPSDAASLSLRLIEADALLAVVTSAWVASSACRQSFARRTDCDARYFP
jgi:hypothetical protein